VAALVRVVLDADQVEPEPVGEQRLLDDGVLPLRVGDREEIGRASCRERV